MKLLELNSIQVLAALDEEIKTWNQNIVKLDQYREKYIQKMHALIKQFETDIGAPAHNSKRLNVKKSVNTKRKLGLFGGTCHPDFEWSAIDKVSDISADKFIKLCGFEWKESQ